jgi:four helix bundle protein
MNKFDHEKLDVYRISIDFISLTEEIIEKLPKKRGYLADQLKRASLSIPLNIAEGAGEFARKEKTRFYRIALRSGTECAAILDASTRIRLVETGVHDRGRELLLRIVSMLTQMVRKLTYSGTGTGTGTD